MRHLGMFFTLAIATGFATGCGQSAGSAASTRGGMAVVDLDKVARETGRDRVLDQSLKLAENSLNQSLKQTLDSAKDQLNTKKKGYGDEISDDEKKEFSDLERSAMTQLSQIQNRARAEYEKYKQNQIVKFRSELKPITQEIAAKRGLSIVIPKNEGLLLSVDPGVDITDEVIKVLREKHPVLPAEPEAEAAAAPKSTTAKRNSAPAKSAARTAVVEEDEEPIR